MRRFFRNFPATVLQQLFNRIGQWRGCGAGASYGGEPGLEELLVARRPRPRG
jgi:hypothetical protein